MLSCAALQGTVVAVKRLLTDDASTIERFVSEVRLLARLRHPNLILFMGYCITPELCIVSEYMSKGSLYGVLHSPEQRKQRAAAAGLTLSAEGSVGDSGELVGCGPSPKKQQLQGQPSLAEGQLPLADEIRWAGVARRRCCVLEACRWCGVLEACRVLSLRWSVLLSCIVFLVYSSFRWSAWSRC